MVETRVVVFLVLSGLLILYAITMYIRASKLTKSPIIRDYVASLEKRSLLFTSYKTPIKDIKKIKFQLKESGKKYSGIIIRQAIHNEVINFKEKEWEEKREKKREEYIAAIEKEQEERKEEREEYFAALKKEQAEEREKRRKEYIAAIEKEQEEREKERKEYIDVLIGEKKKEYLAAPKETLDNIVSEIDEMSGREFEMFLGNLFISQGFKVTLTSYSGDQGVDLLLYKNERKIAVQCKRYNINNRVGNAAIQEVVTGKLYYDCTESWVITSSYFTQHAVNLATKIDVELIDRNDLIAMLKKAYAS